MAARGARVTVSDAYLVAWDEPYHAEYYRRLADRIEGSVGEEIKRVLKDGHSHQAFPVRQLQEPAETLSSIADGSCDVVLSHAVLEHVFDLPMVVKTLARVTAIGGVNIHQIDFRDHRDYDRPLEFLLSSDEEFYLEPDAVLGRGNRWRLSETLHLFEQADFEILESEPDTPCDADYLAEFRRRLPSGNVRFRNADHEDLAFGGAHVTLRRIQ
jgi:SAM-dependent methyltransferase